LIKRRLEDMDIPKGITRATVVFVGALAIAYGVGFLVDRIWP
jgi:VIT1/CCC1 family predicted Fe2+/Mn2+ transporter